MKEQINYIRRGNDFKIVLSFESENGVSIDPAGQIFRFVYRDRFGNGYEISYDGEIRRNCYVDDSGRLIGVFENYPDLTCGRLFREEHYWISDDSFSDGTWDYGGTEVTDIVLEEDKNCADCAGVLFPEEPSVTEHISIPHLKGDPGKSAYKYAVEGGYAETEAKFYTDLGNMEIIHDKVNDVASKKMSLKRVNALSTPTTVPQSPNIVSDSFISAVDIDGGFVYANGSTVYKLLNGELTTMGTITMGGTIRQILLTEMGNLYVICGALVHYWDRTENQFVFTLWPPTEYMFPIGGNRYIGPSISVFVITTETGLGISTFKNIRPTGDNFVHNGANNFKVTYLKESNVVYFTSSSGCTYIDLNTETAVNTEYRDIYRSIYNTFAPKNPTDASIWGLSDSAFTYINTDDVLTKDRTPTRLGSAKHQAVEVTIDNVQKMLVAAIAGDVYLCDVPNSSSNPKPVLVDTLNNITEFREIGSVIYFISSNKLYILNADLTGTLIEECPGGDFERLIIKGGTLLLIRGDEAFEYADDLYLRDKDKWVNSNSVLNDLSQGIRINSASVSGLRDDITALAAGVEQNTQDIVGVNTDISNRLPVYNVLDAQSNNKRWIYPAVSSGSAGDGLMCCIFSNRVVGDKFILKIIGVDTSDKDTYMELWISGKCNHANPYSWTYATAVCPTNNCPENIVRFGINEQGQACIIIGNDPARNWSNFVFQAELLTGINSNAIDINLSFLRLANPEATYPVTYTVNNVNLLQKNGDGNAYLANNGRYQPVDVMKSLYLSYEGVTYEESTGSYIVNSIRVTPEEMKNIYQTTAFQIYNRDLNDMFLASRVKTNLRPARLASFEGSNNYRAFRSSAFAKIYLTNNNNLYRAATDWRLAFSLTRNLVEIIGQIRISADAQAKDLVGMFTDSAVRTFRLVNLFVNFVINTAPNIDRDSILYMIDNATNTSPITITTHANVLARLTEEDIALASSKNITITA